MRYRLTAFCFIVLLPAVSAAPAPDPSVVLDIGPPRKGVSAEVHRQTEIGCLAHPRGMLADTWHDPEVQKLKSIPAPNEYPVHWLAKRIVAKQDGKSNCLRLTFRGGTRAEQVVILNTLARVYVSLKKKRLAAWEESIRRTKREDLNDGVEQLRQVRVVRWAR